MTNYPKSPCEAAVFLAKQNSSKAKKTLIIAEDDKQLRYLSSIARNLFSEQEIITFHHWQTLPYDDLSPSLQVISSRIEALNRILNNQCQIILTSVEALIIPTCSPSFILENSIKWKVEDKLDLQTELELFEKRGYLRVNQVSEMCQFALRGSIVDVFLHGKENPYRIDLFDDEIESIRSFDIETQKTIQNINEIKIFPTREFNLNATSGQNFAKRYFEFTQKPLPSVLLEKISKGQYASGLEN